MIRHFYSHIIETDSIVLELETLDISKNEKHHLIEIMESSIHLSVMDSILSELPKEHRKAFLSHVNDKKHEQAWKLIDSTIKDVRNLILKSAGRVKKELLEDIKNLKNDAKNKT